MSANSAGVAEMPAVRRDERTGAVVIVLDHAEARHGQPERVEHFLTNADVAQAAVDHERIRQG